MELASDMPWLSRSDRALVHVAANLMVRSRTDATLSVQVVTQLRLCLSAMGGTPASRASLPVAADEDDDDPASKFFA